jgi:hypothetical protein
MPTVMQTTWTWWRLDADRYALELHDALTPTGCALEFELFSGEGLAASFGLWRWSATGAALLLVRAGDA